MLNQPERFATFAREEDGESTGSWLFEDVHSTLHENMYSIFKVFESFRFAVLPKKRRNGARYLSETKAGWILIHAHPRRQSRHVKPC